MRVPLPFSRNRPENHSHNLGKALGEGLGLLCAPFTLSIPFTSLSLSPLYPYHLSVPFNLSLFSLSFSLAYLMDVFVLVFYRIYHFGKRHDMKKCNTFKSNFLKKYLKFGTLYSTNQRYGFVIFHPMFFFESGSTSN